MVIMVTTMQTNMTKIIKSLIINFLYCLSKVKVKQ